MNNKPGAPPSLDTARILHLIGELEREVAAAAPDAPGVQDLKDEITTLRNVIGSPKVRHHWVADGLHAVREAAQAVRGEVMRDSVYLAEIGRILGL